MPKYLIQASYTAGGLKGLVKDTATGRKSAVQAAIQSVKGKLECIYFTLSADDVMLIVDAPDNVAVAAFALSVASSGLVRFRTTPLLTVDEGDQLALPARYREPAGRSNRAATWHCPANKPELGQQTLPSGSEGIP